MNRGKSRSLSKRRRYGADSFDGISELPDSILSHILSFLPTKDAVATCILSQRWTLTWTTITNLDFRYRDHCEDQSLKSYEFVDFVNYVLLFQKSAYLNRLSLTFETESIPSNVQARIYSWIYAAVVRNVRELFVCFKNMIPRLPIRTQRIIFGCERLQSLELNCNLCISSEIAVSLPRLEILRLSSIYFQSAEAFCKLLGGCPVLKYLFIDFYMDNLGKFLFKFIISSTSLRHLELYVHNKYPTTRGAFCFIELNAPSLEYIKLEDQVSYIYIEPRLNSLVEADINLASLDIHNQIPNGFTYVVKAFQCAKALTLSTQVIRALSCATIKMNTEFKRLTRLEVTIDWNHSSSLQDFIKLSDGLEVLTIKKDRDTSENYLNNSIWEQPDLVPGCLSDSLKTVSIDVCDGHHNELAMVDYILKHGSVLQVMQICFDELTSDFKTKFEMVKKISKLSKKSHVCKVEFC